MSDSQTGINQSITEVHRSVLSCHKQTTTIISECLCVLSHQSRPHGGLSYHDNNNKNSSLTSTSSFHFINQSINHCVYHMQLYKAQSQSPLSSGSESMSLTCLTVCLSVCSVLTRVHTAIVYLLTWDLLCVHIFYCTTFMKDERLSVSRGTANKVWIFSRVSESFFNRVNLWSEKQQRQSGLEYQSRL